MIQLNVKLKLDENAKVPVYSNEFASGADICSTKTVMLRPNMQAIIPTGLHVSIPDGYEMQIRPRSGLAAKNNISITNSPGTIN